MHSASPPASTVASGERMPQALHVKSARCTHTSTQGGWRSYAVEDDGVGARPGPKSGCGGNGALHTLHEVRCVGAMTPQPAQMRTVGAPVGPRGPVGGGAP